MNAITKISWLPEYLTSTIKKNWYIFFRGIIYTENVLKEIQTLSKDKKREEFFHHQAYDCKESSLTYHEK